MENRERESNLNGDKVRLSNKVILNRKELFGVKTVRIALNGGRAKHRGEE